MQGKGRGSRVPDDANKYTVNLSLNLRLTSDVKIQNRGGNHLRSFPQAEIDESDYDCSLQTPDGSAIEEWPSRTSALRNASTTKQVKPHSRSLDMMRDYSAVFIGHSLSALIGFITSVYLAHALVKGDFGAYSTFIALTTVFSSAVDIGITPSVVRFGAKMYSERDYQNLANIVGGAILGKMILGVAAGLVGLAVIFGLGFSEDLYGWQILVLVPVTGIVISFFVMTQGVLQIRRDFSKVSIILVLRGGLFLALIFSATFVVTIGLLLVCLMLLLTTTLSIVPFARLYSKSPMITPKLSKSSWTEAKRLLRFGKWIAVTGLSFTLIHQIPIAAILGYYGPDSAADFSVAIAMIGILGIISVPLMTVLVPDLSRISTKSELRNYYHSTYRFLLPLSIAVLVGYFFFSEAFIHLFYGLQYSGSVELLRILVVPFVLSFVLMPINFSLTYVFGRPFISSLSNLMQLGALAMSILAIGMLRGPQDFVILYGIIKVAGAIGVMIVAISFIKKSSEVLDSNRDCT